jgi:DNA polymerase III alpha subunit (gram-positive type)
MQIKKEIYVSTDIEADGKIPGPNSMLSLGSVALTEDGEVLGTFSANLIKLEGAVGDPDTLEWWKGQPKAWAQVMLNREAPEVAMKRYHAWLSALPGSPVFVGYPASYDFLFTYWYLIKFTGSSPFSFSALDIKTLAMAAMKKPYRKSTKQNMPNRWFDKTTNHTHVALDDAMEQGKLFINIWKEIRNE